MQLKYNCAWCGKHVILTYYHEDKHNSMTQAYKYFCSKICPECLKGNKEESDDKNGM